MLKLDLQSIANDFVSGRIDKKIIIITPRAHAQRGVK